MNDNIALVSRCMDILCKHVGVIEAERFVYLIKTETFDYTKWQRDHYDAISQDELRNAVQEYCNEHPFSGAKAVMLD